MKKVIMLFVGLFLLTLSSCYPDNSYEEETYVIEKPNIRIYVDPDINVTSMSVNGKNIPFDAPVDYFIYAKINGNDILRIIGNSPSEHGVINAIEIDENGGYIRNICSYGFTVTKNINCTVQLSQNGETVLDYYY